MSVQTGVVHEAITTTQLPRGPHEFGRRAQPPNTRVLRQVVEVDLPTPPMGGKGWLLSEKGIFVLQRGSGTLRTIACTHAGSGNLEAIDGIPDERGFFPDEQMAIPLRENFTGSLVENASADERYLAALKAYHTRNGRPFYRANPVMMGSWMLDAGFNHGLTLRAEGGHDSTSAIATVVWMPFRQRGA